MFNKVITFLTLLRGDRSTILFSKIGGWEGYFDADLVTFKGEFGTCKSQNVTPLSVTPHSLCVARAPSRAQLSSIHSRVSTLVVSKLMRVRIVEITWHNDALIFYGFIGKKHI